MKLNRKFGKILALLLALTMMLSYAAGVLADDPPIDVDVKDGEKEIHEAGDVSADGQPAVDIDANTGGVAVVDVEDVNATNLNDEAAIDIDADHDAVVVVDAEDVTSEGGSAIDIVADHGSDVVLDADDVTAKDLKYSDEAINIEAKNGGTVDVDVDDVTATGKAVTGIDIESENGDVTVDAGDVKAVATGDDASTGIEIETEGKNSRVDVKVDNVTADRAIDIENGGGNVKVETKNINAERSGIDVGYDLDDEESEDATEEEVKALDLTFAEVYDSPQEDGTTIKRLNFPDGTSYVVYYDKNGKFLKAEKQVAKGIPGKTTVKVNGDINVTGEFAETGIDISSNVKSSETRVEVAGDVNVNQKTDGKGSEVTGVYEYAGDDALASVDIKKNLSVTGERRATGANEEAFYGTTELKVGGDLNVKAGQSATGITANAHHGGDASFTVGGSISVTQDETLLGKDDPIQKTKKDDRYYLATGVSIDAEKGSTVEGTVEGEISVVGDKNATGMYVYADGESKVDVTIGEGIYAEGGENATGLSINASDNKTSIDVDILEGGVEAKGTKNVKAISTTNNGGEIDLFVNGDVVSSGNGLYLSNDRDSKLEAVDKSFTIDAKECISVYTGKDENGKEYTYKRYRHIEGDKVYIYDNEGNVWEEKLTDKAKEAEDTTRVEIVGDVTAEEGGIVIDMPYEKSKLDVIVDGTVSGELASVLLDERTVTDGVTLTVWAIEENENGNLAERYHRYMDDKGEWQYELLGADEEFEQEIQYIIKVEQPELGELWTEGTYDYEGYNVAHQGDEVTMKVNLPFGYRVKNAFNGTDTKVKLGRNSKGQYYLTVPRGGGVMLSVTLERVPSVITYYPEGGTINGSTDPYVVRSVLTNAPKLLDAPEWEGHTFLYWNIQTVKKDNEKWVAPNPASDTQYNPGDRYYLKNEVVTVTAVWADAT